MPFLGFEGEFPHKPVVAIEIADRKPDDWSPLLVEAWGDAMNDPGEWAKAAERAGASIITLQLSLTDADGQPNTPEKAQQAVRKVLKATGLPVIVLGPGQVDADNDLLVAVAEEASGERLLLDEALSDCFEHWHPAVCPLDAEVALGRKRCVEDVVIHGCILRARRRDRTP